MFTKIMISIIGLGIGLTLGYYMAESSIKGTVITVTQYDTVHVIRVEEDTVKIDSLEGVISSYSASLDHITNTVGRIVKHKKYELSHQDSIDAADVLQRLQEYRTEHPN